MMDSFGLDNMMMDYVHRMTLEISRNRNDFREHGKSFSAYLAAQQQTKTMQTHLDSLTQLIEPGLSGNVEAQRHLKAIREGLTTQQANLNQLLKSVPPVARKPPNADELASKVFAIPELLERILLYLSTNELLQAQQVNRPFFDAIRASPKIQFKMGLRPLSKGHLFFPPVLCVHQFSIYPETYTTFTNNLELAPNEVIMKANFYGSEKTPDAGKRCRQMLICQPPIKSLNVHTRCCHPAWSFRHDCTPAETITVETGITIGDLIDAYNRVTTAHKLCPDADPHEHDYDGFVKPRVSFETRVVVQDDDPALLERRQNDKKRKDEDTKWGLHAQRMAPYITAKQQARDNDQPIPTLAEFESTEGVAAPDRDTSTDGIFTIGAIPLP